MTHLTLIAALALGQGPAHDKTDPGPLVRALWLVQRFGTAKATAPSDDQRTKGILAKAIGKDGVIQLTELGDLMEPGTFAKLAGSEGNLNTASVARAVEDTIPASRRALLPKIREHVDFLTTSLDQIDERHREASVELADWIAKRYRPEEPLNVIAVCTGNSRRSILTSAMGNIAAAYYGMPEVRFYSGGTAPTAFNPRTVNALKTIGVEIEQTDKEAKRGEPATANPIYRIRWGQDSSTRLFETTEFSKLYSDPSNPQNGFAALMVCGEADVACPFVKGASLRLSVPYLDPKIYDGGAYETAKYVERRDDIGRFMLAVMMQARNRR